MSVLKRKKNPAEVTASSIRKKNSMGSDKVTTGNKTGVGNIKKKILGGSFAVLFFIVYLGIFDNGVEYAYFKDLMYLTTGFALFTATVLTFSKVE